MDRTFTGRCSVMNMYISVAAFVVATAQLLFVYNLVWSLRHGHKTDGNPWRAASLEWQTPQTPPVHGNWGPHLPVVYRWAYAYSVPGAPEDFIAQNAPPEAGGSEPEPHASRGAVA